MIELTAYDGYTVRDKVSVMVSQIKELVTMTADTTLIIYIDKGSRHVTENRSKIQNMINQYLKASQ